MILTLTKQEAIEALERHFNKHINIGNINFIDFSKLNQHVMCFKNPSKYKTLQEAYDASLEPTIGFYMSFKEVVNIACEE